MLIGRLLINGTDVYSTYGMYVKDDDLGALLKYPSYKAASIVTNDWHESDGMEADLSAPVLDGRQVQLTFHLAHPGAPSDAQVLLSDLTSQVYHTFLFLRLGKTYRLRLVSSPSFAQNARFDTLSLTFADDFAAIPNTAAPMQATGIPQGYFIDDAEFALYGCTVLKGTRDSFLRFANTKEALKNSYSTVAGVTYDAGDNVRLQPKDITLNLHIRTATVSDFWQRWDALWTAVLRIDATVQTVTERAVRTIEGDGMTFRCYYKQNDIKRFLFTPEGGVWLDFSITFSVLAYTLGEEWFYLITQDNFPVLFEDDDPENPAHYIRIR